VNRNWPDPHIELVHASNICCLPHRGDGERAPIIHAEADGEILGRVPAMIRAVPNALNLLVPSTASSFENRFTFSELPRQ
jgi:diacylglycerol kinase family enzyme